MSGQHGPWLAGCGGRQEIGVTYPDIVLELDPTGRVQLDLLQRLSDHIVGLALARLGGLDRGGLLYVALVVDVELVEGIGERKDVALLKLRVFPGGGGSAMGAARVVGITGLTSGA